MHSEGIKTRKIKIVFYSVAVLLTAQVMWWTWTFLSRVDEVARLKSQLLPSTDARMIQTEAFHQRLMFLSESAFFLLATGTGIILLYRALRVEEKAREAQKTFVEIMSHESKTPLTALKLRLESLRQKREKDEELVKGLDQSLLEVRRLASLFDKAMTLSRSETPRETTEIIPLPELVRSVLARIDPLIRDREVKTSVLFDGSPHVKGDAAALQSSVQSLLENAVYYNDREQRVVKVTVKAQGGKARLLVEDNGPGIAEAERDRVFDKFYRGVGQRSVPGSGLGLYLAKRVVEAHAGTLQVSTSELGGVCFSVELPLLEAA